ncbi:MAG: class I SAM-dependent methyltransferase [Bacteroidetes bacterium]|nr:class I SAM-dependent methyltransferase [Bacteroidota bacterium]
MAKDLFSNYAQQYQSFRPTYPAELFEFIYRHTNNFDTAWDCATGNGQAAIVLANKFRKVYATDISQSQLAHATQANNVEYSTVAAEDTKFADGTFDLITVAQAAHWFNHDLFYHEANRIAKKGATLALWGYGLLRVNSTIDHLIQDFYTKTVGPYWDPERRHIDAHYRSLPFPFEEIDTPDFSFSLQWTLEQLHGYLGTWSAVHKFKMANEFDPVAPLIEQLRPLWEGHAQTITFPLFLRLGKL